jgi:hypothetical protein
MWIQTVRLNAHTEAQTTYKGRGIKKFIRG